MTRFYCDVCGEEVANEEDPTRPIQLTIKEVVFKDFTLNAEKRPFVMCDMCYSKFTSALADKFANYNLGG